MTDKQLTITRIQSGGLITNYHCSSQCMHCLYASSPKRNKGYITKEAAARVFTKSKSLGCFSLHIGGGEPLLNIQKLVPALEAAQEENMSIQYVETNSSWYKDHDSACKVMEQLMAHSVTSLLVSISPFHNEYIPFYKVKGVMAACQSTGMSSFPWIGEFYNDIDSFPDDIPHSISEYSEAFGPDFIKKVLRKYWIHPGGRALGAFSKQYSQRKTEAILEDCTGCVELTDTSHFHLDLHENYIPGLCSGTQIAAQDLGAPLSPEKYPFLDLLYNKGIKGFYQIASQEYGFKPKEKYAFKCQLCLDIRRFLVVEKKIGTIEFGPVDFYETIEREKSGAPA